MGEKKTSLHALHLFKFYVLIIREKCHILLFIKEGIVRGEKQVREGRKEGVDVGIFWKHHSLPTLNLIKLSSLKL